MTAEALDMNHQTIPLPPLVLDDFSYAPQNKPALLLTPDRFVFEFSNLEAATAYLENARRAGANAAGESTVYALHQGEWVRAA